MKIKTWNLNHFNFCYHWFELPWNLYTFSSVFTVASMSWFSWTHSWISVDRCSCSEDQTSLLEDAAITAWRASFRSPESGGRLGSTDMLFIEGTILLEHPFPLTAWRLFVDKVVVVVLLIGAAVSMISPSSVLISSTSRQTTQKVFSSRRRIIGDWKIKSK